MFFLVLILNLALLTSSEIIDYTSHEYLLFKDNKDILTYDSYADLFHVTNLSFYEGIINTESRSFNKSSKTDVEWEISMDLKLIKFTLSEIMPKRQKRRINEVRTLWKWVAGTLDHDDFITVQNKIDNLIKNNNKQFIIHSKLFNEVKYLTENLKN